MKKLTSGSMLLLPIFMILGLFQGRAQYSITYQNPPNGGGFSQMAVDGLGNSYYTGSFVDSIQFGSLTLYKPVNWSSPSPQFFVAKMNASGSWVWARSIPSFVIRNVAADNSGNAYVSGNFSGTINLDAVTISSPNGKGSLFVAKMNSSGTFLWAASKATKFANGGGATGRAVTTDASGNVYLTGEIDVSPDYSTQDGIYWAKYNSSGLLQWDKTLSSNTTSILENRGLAIAADGSGNVYVTGNFQGSVKFANGAGNTISTVGQGAFVTKLNSSGAFQWVKSATPSTSNGRVTSPGLDLDASGNIYIGGMFKESNLLFPGSSTTLANATTAYNGFLAKYSSSGTLSWAVSATDSASPQFGFALFKHPSGNVGAYHVRKGASLIYEFSSSGSVVSSTASIGSGTTGWHVTNDVAYTSLGYMVLGSITGTVAFGNLTLTGACSYPSGIDCNIPDVLVLSYTGSAPKPTSVAASNLNPAMHLQAYPNPLNDILHLRSSNGSSIGRVAIYDHTGRKVIEKTIAENNAQLSIPSLPAGVYFLKADQQAGAIKLWKND